MARENKKKKKQQQQQLCITSVLAAELYILKEDSFQAKEEPGAQGKNKIILELTLLSFQRNSLVERSLW